MDDLKLCNIFGPLDHHIWWRFAGRIANVCQSAPKGYEVVSDLHVKWDRPKVDQIGAKEGIRWENPLEWLKILEKVAERK